MPDISRHTRGRLSLLSGATGATKMRRVLLLEIAPASSRPRGGPQGAFKKLVRVLILVKLVSFPAFRIPFDSVCLCQKHSSRSLLHACVLSAGGQSLISTSIRSLPYLLQLSSVNSFVSVIALAQIPQPNKQTTPKRVPRPDTKL